MLGYYYYYYEDDVQNEFNSYLTAEERFVIEAYRELNAYGKKVVGANIEMCRSSPKCHRKIISIDGFIEQY